MINKIVIFMLYAYPDGTHQTQAITIFLTH